MEFLHWLESIRSPFLDSLMGLITQLGEDLVFTVVIIGTLWCINKRDGFWMFFSWGMGTGINQLVKAICKIPRPWVRDPSLKVVESAIPAATGYSFPSGHTQSVIGLFGSLAVFVRKWAVTILSIVLILLTGFSRMYLGVHTPADVLCAFGIGIVVLALMAWFASLEKRYPNITRLASAMLIAISLALLLYAAVSGSDDENMLHGLENGWKMLGASIGLSVAWELDRKVLKFETKALWYVQIVKFLVGILGALAIQAGLKQPLLSLFGGSYVAHGVRYLLLTVFVGILYPLTFAWWSKLGTKK
ncbi:MAG: phosphatase PAP2 family protein [Clostridia bacterium]|nr:phosphatase PAP2 family protein [Clostridia bacterium]